MLFALQHVPVDSPSKVDYSEGNQANCMAWFTERALVMEPFVLALWLWVPQEGWKYIAGSYRVMKNGPVRELQIAPPPPDQYEQLPGEESALEFAADESAG